MLVTGDFAAHDVGGLAGAPWPQKPYSLLLLGITALNHQQLPTADPKANRMPYLQEVDTLSRQGKNVPGQIPSDEPAQDSTARYWPNRRGLFRPFVSCCLPKDISQCNKKPWRKA